MAFRPVSTIALRLRALNELTVGMRPHCFAKCNMGNQHHPQAAGKFKRLSSDRLSTCKNQRNCSYVRHGSRAVLSPVLNSCKTCWLNNPDCCPHGLHRVGPRSGCQTAAPLPPAYLCTMMHRCRVCDRYPASLQRQALVVGVPASVEGVVVAGRRGCRRLRHQQRHHHLQHRMRT
jgi:hypothetical protein